MRERSGDEPEIPIRRANRVLKLDYGSLANVCNRSRRSASAGAVRGRCSTAWPDDMN